MKKEIIKMIEKSLECERTIYDVKKYVIKIIHIKYKVWESSLIKELNRISSIPLDDRLAPCFDIDVKGLVNRAKKCRKYTKALVLIDYGFIEKYLKKHPHENLIK